MQCLFLAILELTSLQGFFSGTYNAIAGKIKGPQGEIGEVSGMWSDVMEIQRKGVSLVLSAACVAPD